MCRCERGSGASARRPARATHGRMPSSTLGELVRAQLVTALAVVAEALAPCGDIGVFQADDLGKPLEAREKRRRRSLQIDQYGGGPMVFEGMVDPYGRLGGQP